MFTTSSRRRKVAYFSIKAYGGVAVVDARSCILGQRSEQIANTSIQNTLKKRRKKGQHNPIWAVDFGPQQIGRRHVLDGRREHDHERPPQQQSKRVKFSGTFLLLGALMVTGALPNQTL